MQKKKNKEVEEEVVTPEVKEETVAVEEKKKEVEVKYPEVTSTGKFQAVKVEGGLVVYNPCGQRVSGVLKPVEAQDIVRQQNLAAHL